MTGIFKTKLTDENDACPSTDIIWAGKIPILELDPYGDMGKADTQEVKQAVLLLPDLLETLEEFKDILKKCCFDCLLEAQPVLEKIETVLAKVRGES